MKINNVHEYQNFPRKCELWGFLGKPKLFHSQTFRGNSDKDTIVDNILQQSVRAKFIRLYPTDWYGYMTLRWDIIGCYGHIAIGILVSPPIFFK